MELRQVVEGKSSARAEKPQEMELRQVVEGKSLSERVEKAQEVVMRW